MGGQDLLRIKIYDLDDLTAKYCYFKSMTMPPDVDGIKNLKDKDDQATQYYDLKWFAT